MVEAKDMQKKLILLVGALLLFSLGGGTTAWADILFIANPESAITTLDRHELRAIYLNRSSTWPNGMKIKRAILVEEGPHQEFCQDFLGKSTSQLERYWRRQLYMGKALPPVELKTSQEVINYVRSTPGALGFIRDQPRPKGVLPLKIKP